MPPTFAPKTADILLDEARVLFTRHFPGHPLVFVERLIAAVTDMFEGRYLDYSQVDLKYHDFDHSLQASSCFLAMLDGRQQAGAKPAFSAREAELGLTAILMHDTGYLHLRSDKDGTGAKYTYTHVLRSCAITASFLPRMGLTAEELDLVVVAIRCTGPSSQVSRLHFPGESAKVIGCMVATADYLGQMAARDYPSDLALLYAEFEESDDFTHVPREKRMFRSAMDLAQRTPAFWDRVVLPKLDSDFLGVYRFLQGADGVNPYIAAINHNLARIRAGELS